MSLTSFSLPNYELAAEVKGLGRPAMVLHGAGGTGQFAQVVDELSKHRRVIFPTHPGFDETPSPSWLDAVEDIALLYLDLLDLLESEAVDLIGFSLGGWVALELGVIAGPRIRSVTLVGAPGISNPEVSFGNVFQWPAQERIQRLVFAPDLAQRLAGAPADAAEMKRRQNNWDMTSMLAQQAAWHSTRLEKWLHRLSMPVHVIWGEQDALFPVGLARSYKARLPHAKLTVLSECGHLVHLERHEELMQSITKGLQEVDDIKELCITNRGKVK